MDVFRTVYGQLVIHGKTQRFLVKSLRVELGNQLEEAQMTIGNGKKRLIYLQKLLEDTDEREEYLKPRIDDRKAAWARFQHEIKQKRRQAQIIGNWRNKSFHDMFRRWAYNVQERKRKRGVVTRVIQRLLKRDLHSAFDKWIEVMHFISVLDSEHKGISGIGSEMLQLAREARESLNADAAEALNQIRRARVDLDEQKYTIHQRKRLEEGPLYDASAEADERAFVEDSSALVADFNKGKAHLKPEKSCLL